MSGITSNPEPFLLELKIASAERSVLAIIEVALCLGIGVVHICSSELGSYPFKFWPSEIATIPLKGTIIRSSTLFSNSRTLSAAL